MTTGRHTHRTGLPPFTKGDVVTLPGLTGEFVVLSDTSESGEYVSLGTQDGRWFIAPFDAHRRDVILQHH